MKLLVTGRFSTVVTAGGEQRRFAAAEGQMFELDEQTAAALLRDVGGCLQAVAETVEAESVVEMVEVPAEVVAPPKVARTRQVAHKPIRPGPRPTAKKVKR